MKSFLIRVVRSLKFRATRALVTPSSRHLRQVRGPGFEIVLFLNEHVGRWIWANGIFEKEETLFFQREVQSSDICFDVGGNVGYMALLFASKATEGQTYSFEPISLNASIIRTNAELNGMENLNVINTAVGAEKGEVQFSVSTDSAYSSMHATGRMAEERSITVPVLSLDDFIAEKGLSRVDILKVDVEGAEAMVVEGAATLLRDPQRRPRIVLLELYNQNLAGFGVSVDSCLAQMAELGYAPFYIPPGQAELAPFERSMTDKYSNVIFRPAN